MVDHHREAEIEGREFMADEMDPKDQDNQPTSDDFELEEPDTESVGRSPVTGQTADDSQDAPGQ